MTRDESIQVHNAMELMTLLDAVVTDDVQRCERDNADVGGVSYGSRDQVGTMIRDKSGWRRAVDVMVMFVEVKCVVNNYLL